MSLSTPFVHRPVATTLLAVGVLLAGGIAYFQLPVAALPRVEYPTIMVTASLARPAWASANRESLGAWRRTMLMTPLRALEP